jgi:hypothetical protein
MVISTEEVPMNGRPEYPEFSSIRSHVQRADAMRSFEIGYALADALLDAGDFLRRAVSALASMARALGARVARR